MTSPRESHLVELVDAAGVAIGAMTVAQAHTAPGHLHRAFSVMLTDAEGRLLLQRRSAVKTRFPLRWANSCCGHPPPGEPPADSAAARVADELGAAIGPLKEVGVFTYRASDPVSGRVEHEYDHVLVGVVAAEIVLSPDPAEVAAVRWVSPAQLRAGLAAEPDAYAPWLAGVLKQLASRP
jgi:isopentenyl-diphosphate delta-isomerase